MRIKSTESNGAPVLLKPQREAPFPFEGDLKAFLPRLELFHGIAPSVLAEFALKLRVSRFAAQEFLPPQPELETSCWIVLEGAIERRVISSAGHVTAVDVAAQGDIFGCLFNDSSVPLHIESVALAPSITGSIACQDGRTILTHAPSFNQNLILLLARRLYEARELRAMAGEPARTRILWSLLLLHSKLGAELPLTRANMAEVAGVTRETAVRALSPLEKNGYIRSFRGKIDILDPRGLAEMLGKARGSPEAVQFNNKG